MGRRYNNKKKFPNEEIIERYINERYPGLGKKDKILSTILYIVADELGITEGHHCHVCNKLIINYKNFHTDRKFCSIECRNKSKEWSGNIQASARITYDSPEYKERMSKIGKSIWDNYSEEEKKKQLGEQMQS